MPVQTVIKLRRDTASNWTTADSVLGSGEPGLETDTGKIKFGDGSTAWTSLAYSYDAVENDFGSVALTTLTNGDVLQYDGTDWTNAQLDALPTQTGQSGNYLTTNGSAASWAAIDIPPGTTVSDTAPSTPESGQLWWDSSDGTLYIYYDSYWVQAVTGITGPRGSDNIVTASTAPSDLDVLWIDTSEDGDAVLPLAGTTGQVLSKVDGADYNTEWTTLDLSAIYTTTFITDTTTARTLIATDSGKTIRFTSGSATVVTVDASTDFTVGTRVDIIADGAGELTVAASTATVAGAATSTTSGSFTVGAQYSSATLLCVATDEYRLIGNVAAV